MERGGKRDRNRDRDRDTDTDRDRERYIFHDRISVEKKYRGREVESKNKYSGSHLM